MGANVVFGDLEVDAGRKFAEELDPRGERVIFVQMDITKYDEIVKLFKTAWQKYGRIDHGTCQSL